MSTTTQTATAPIADGAWRIDPARSSVAFHVRHFYGLMAVKGEFADYEGTLDLNATPAVELTIQPASPLGILRAPSKLIVRGRLVRR